MRTPLCDMFGIEYPIFAFSHCRDVVAAVTNAGGMGVLGALAFSPEELELIAGLAHEFDTWVITDEVYEHIVFPPHRHTYIAALPGMFERTLSCSSLSKKRRANRLPTSASLRSSTLGSFSARKRRFSCVSRL